jgi:transcriptional regulator with XRE-family HTH domain
MTPFARNLKRRAQALGLPDAEVARRCGLTERRYGNYATGRREPDLATLVKIAAVLQVSVDALLSEAGDGQPSGDPLGDRLLTAAAALNDAERELVVVQVEALAKWVAARARPGP